MEASAWEIVMGPHRRHGGEGKPKTGKSRDIHKIRMWKNSKEEELHKKKVGT